MMVGPHGSRTIPRRRLLTAAAAAVAGFQPPAHAARAGIDVIVGHGGWLFPIWDAAEYVDPDVLPAITKCINTAAGLLRRGGIAVAVVLLPAKSRVYRDFLPADHRLPPVIAQRYGQGLRALAGDTMVLDHAALFDDFRKNAPTDDLFFKADTHWLPVGAAVSASAMADLIESKAKLPPSAKPGLKLSPPKPATQSSNDLAALLPPAQRVNYPPQTYLARPPAVVGDPGDLLDEDVPDTVVIGNSFMQPAYGFAATLSSELNRPVGLTWKVHQFSPYWTLLSYLRSPAFTQSRPKLIVWTFHEVDLTTPFDSIDVWGPSVMPQAAFLTQLRRLVQA